METVDEVNGGQFEGTTIVTQSSLSEHIANPLVYKLVRVEGDGRFVPATDDEVMEVEELLGDDRSSMDFEGAGQTIGCMQKDDMYFEKSQAEDSGKCQSGNSEVNIEKLGDHYEESAPSPAPSLNEKDVHGSPTVDACLNTPEEPRKTTSDASELIAPEYIAPESDAPESIPPESVAPESIPPESVAPESIPPESVAPESIPPESVAPESVAPESVAPESVAPESIAPESVAPESCRSPDPDFSKLKGDIYLDNLSIRELHATFKAAFGRDTSVKDKLWLKRRIAMGLTNSCNISTTRFIIKDNKLVQGDEEIRNDADPLLTKDLVVGVEVKSSKSSVSHSCETEVHQTIFGSTLKPFEESHYKSEAPNNEQRGAKRVRKPTKRYIEELSEFESYDHNGRLISATKTPGSDDSSPKSSLEPSEYGCSDARPLVTRLDSFGGSGVHVPYVSRVRRSRPRKNFVALMEIHPSDFSAQLVKKARDVHSSQPVDETVDGVLKPGPAPEQLEQSLITRETGLQVTVKDTVAREQKVDPRREYSSGSDGNVATATGIRRKHHRAWSLSEVMKLVEGVSRYGAGRWAEIKKVAFPSYTYRTTVDLKDKWRNLLRASSAQMPARNGLHSKKHTSAPIPAAILMRVRELAEMNAQATPKIAARPGGRSVNERSGYL